MIDTHKFLLEIEDMAYSSLEKQEADKLIDGYCKLFNVVDFNDYKLSLKKDLKIIIKHKAFANKIILHFNNNSYYINNEKINLNLINNILLNYFNIDKKN
jgi:hypothetical protein